LHILAQKSLLIAYFLHEDNTLSKVNCLNIQSFKIISFGVENQQVKLQIEFLTKTFYEIYYLEAEK
jgi:hypothetical protein